MSGRHPQDIAIDLAIELVGAALAATIAWTFIKFVQQYAPPLWVAVLLPVLATFALTAIVGYVLRTRAIRQVQQQLALQSSGNESLTGQLNQTRQALYNLRETNRRVAEQLLAHIDPEGLSYVARYVVAIDNKDRIETEWTVTFPDATPGCVFFVEEWSSYPVDGDVTCTCESNAPGTSVIPVSMVDEPTHQRLAVYLAPPVNSVGRNVLVRHHWPNLWKDLRERGADYIEIAARQGLKQAKIQIEIPVSLGTYGWAKNTNPNIQLSRSESGVQQTLEISVPAPRAGQIYKADIRKS